MLESARRIEVICYAGYRGEETPRRFYLDERLVEVAEIIDRWLDPNHRYFKVLSSEEDHCILRHDCQTDNWELVKIQPAT